MECPVCYSDNCACHTLTCGHIICKSCVKQWYTTSPEPDCPMCRAPLNFKGLHRFRAKWEEEADKKRTEYHYSKAIDRALEDWSGFSSKVLMYVLRSLDKNFRNILPWLPALTDDAIEYALDPTNLVMNLDAYAPSIIVWEDFNNIFTTRELMVSKHSPVRGYQNRIICA